MVAHHWVNMRFLRPHAHGQGEVDLVAKPLLQSAPSSGAEGSPRRSQLPFGVIRVALATDLESYPFGTSQAKQN